MTLPTDSGTVTNHSPHEYRPPFSRDLIRRLRRELH
jgi:hypothetical protein